MQPVKDNHYSLSEVFSLDIPDSPSLMFFDGDNRVYIQHAHLTNQQFLSISGFAETVWTYLYTTYEWVPCFQAVDSEKVKPLCEIKNEYGQLSGYPIQ